MAVMLGIGGASIGAWQPGEHRGFEVFGEPCTPAWFELHTREYEPSVSFYREVFGWTTAVESDIPEFRYTTYKHDEMMEAGIMDAAPFTDAGAPAQWSIYFAVDSTDEAVAKAVELGGAVVAAPMDSPYGRLATVTDSTSALFRPTAQG